GQFAYAALAVPVTLAANATYVLMSQEISGGDQWYDYYNTYIILSGAASGVAGMWAYNNPPPVNGASWGEDQSYGPVNLRYKIGNAGDDSAWLMNGATYVSGATIPLLTDVNWRMVGTGDFNNDGQLDILWRHSTTGQNSVWYMNGNTYLSTAMLEPVSDTN